MSVRLGKEPASLCETPSNRSIYRGAKIISWTGVIGSQGELYFLKHLNLFAFFSFVCAHTAQDKQQTASAEFKAKMFTGFNPTVNHKS